MELENLKSLWRENDVNLERDIVINPLTLSALQKQNAKSALIPLFWGQIIELGFHSLAIILFCIFCFYNYNQWPYALSGYMLILFYSVTFTNCISQLRTISNINPKNQIVVIQSSLAKIQSSRLNYLRLSVLFIPALLSFPVVISKALLDFHITFWKFNIIQQSHGNYWIIQIIAIAVCLPLGLWFRNKVSYRNIHIKWVSVVIQKSAGTRVRKAMEYLNELEKLRSGDGTAL